MPKTIYPPSSHTYQDYPFLKNKWYPHYIKLMETRSALNRKHIPNISKTHRHHMLPKSLGGPDTKDNKVVLTWNEHFIAHALLVRITEGDNYYKMMWALRRICQIPSQDPEQQITFARHRGSRVYVSNMEALAEARKTRIIKKVTLETREKQRKSQLGKKQSTETIEKRRQALLGRKRSPEAIEKTRQFNLGRKQTPEHIERRRQTRIGRKTTIETREKQRRSQLGRLHLPTSLETREKQRRSHLGVPWSDARRRAHNRMFNVTPL